MAKPIVAIMYDFDKTLSTTDMQNYSFIPDLGLKPEEFWGKTSKFTEEAGVERILAYMYMMIEEAKKKNIKLTRKYLNKCGKNIEFYPGVETWFKRINAYGLKKGIKVEHYLVSSGTKEIVEGCKIYKEFTKAYGCEYYYNKKGEPVWPKLAINFTQKTQFFFRIAKGAFDVTDDKSVNEKTKNGLRIPFNQIIYLGDGMTDIACMTLVKKNGGKSIALYQKGDSDKVREIYDDNRVNFMCPANYEKGSSLEKIIRMVIDSVALTTEMTATQIKLAK
ncbi:MAG: haloacid dehalogenase-like hydrolase [Bacilli bacterium]|nr:haloacid dehalogenase-like hydrolase [Bacilli bacterium]